MFQKFLRSPLFPGAAIGTKTPWLPQVMNQKLQASTVHQETGGKRSITRGSAKPIQEKVKSYRQVVAFFQVQICYLHEKIPGK
jgi:hypothetical protein